MQLRTFITSSFFTRSIFVVSLFLLLFISGIFYRHSVALNESTEWVFHSYKVQAGLANLLSNAKDAEAEQRGYLLTGDSTFLVQYGDARQKINTSFRTLRKLTGDNLRQLSNLDSLNMLVSLRFNYLSDILKKAGAGQLDKRQLDASMALGKDLMYKISDLADEMNKVESLDAKVREKKYKNEISFTPIFLIMLLLFSLLIIVLSYVKITNDVDILKKANRALQITTESFKHAEEIGDFSSWQWNFTTNKLIYSDNQYRLLGCEPGSFEPNLASFTEFVHPEDRHVISEGETTVINSREPSVAYFRIIRKDGELRYFKSIGKFLTDINGDKNLIGINVDITQQRYDSMALESKNMELEQTNSELASFNHIASHDLQQPLRKIQTYISRINDSEAGNLTEAGLRYFSRIKASADHMRRLIDDLLLFSRANKAEKVFEQADLNSLLENSKQELTTIIEEKNAVIIGDKLPVLHVIPFQIEQLFTNLIGNSLKYCKPDVRPVITIRHTTIKAKDYPFNKPGAGYNKYSKITVKDNGIGFEQEYAESIFRLFHRLDHTADFSGTGIGLSICKKIIENHSGHILAESAPDEGATFTFFLPA